MVTSLNYSHVIDQNPESTLQLRLFYDVTSVDRWMTPWFLNDWNVACFKGLGPADTALLNASWLVIDMI